MTIALQQSGTQTLGTNAPNAALIRATKRRLVNAFWWKLLFTRLPNVGEDSRVLEIYTTERSRPPNFKYVLCLFAD